MRTPGGLEGASVHGLMPGMRWVVEDAVPRKAQREEGEK